MGNLRALLTLALLPAAACGGDKATPDALVIIDSAPDATPIDAPIDAPSYDFTCLGNAAPTTASATITLAGTAREVVLNGATPAVQVAAGVAIEACKGNCNGPNSLGNTTSANDGTFITPALDAMSLPLDGYLIATKTGNRDTYIYPASPLTENTLGVPVVMISTSALAAAVGLGLITQSPANGLVGTFVTDCANTPIPDAVVAIMQNGVAVGDTQNAGAFDPQGAGAFITFDVPPGDSTVTATYGGMSFRSHVVSSLAGKTATTQIKPGF